jgi:hypothetical protein
MVVHGRTLSQPQRKTNQRHTKRISLTKKQVGNLDIENEGTILK